MCALSALSECARYGPTAIFQTVIFFLFKNQSNTIHSITLYITSKISIFLTTLLISPSLSTMSNKSNSSKASKASKGKQQMSARREIQYSEQGNMNQFSPLNQFSNQFLQSQQLSNMNPFLPSQQFSNNNQFLPPQQFSNMNQFTNHFQSQQPIESQPLPQYHTHQSSSPNFSQMLNQPYNEYPTRQSSSSSSKEDDVNVPEETTKTTKNAFSRREDILLAKAYVRTTDNSITGKDQKASVYWQSITNEYNDMAQQEGHRNREAKSLKNRMTRMRGEMVTFNEAIHFVDSVHHTGINDMDRMKMVHTRFVELNTKYKNRPFAFDHVLDILNQCSKFNYTTTKRNKTPRQERTDSSPSNGSPTTPIGGGSNASTKESMQYHSGDKRSRASTDDISSPSRPTGSKAAKKLEKLKGKKGKGKSVQGEHAYEVVQQMSIERTKWYADESNNNEKRHFEKLRLFQEAIEVEKSKIEMKRDAERERLQHDRELGIMSMDLNTLATDEERNEFKQMRKKIMAKWKASGLM